MSERFGNTALCDGFKFCQTLQKNGSTKPNISSSSPDIKANAILAMMKY